MSGDLVPTSFLDVNIERASDALAQSIESGLTMSRSLPSKAALSAVAERPIVRLLFDVLEDRQGISINKIYERWEALDGVDGVDVVACLEILADAGWVVMAPPFGMIWKTDSMFEFARSRGDGEIITLRPFLR